MPTIPSTVGRDSLARETELSKPPVEPPRPADLRSDGATVPPAAPRTELGRRLWDIRRRIVTSGVPLLDWDQIEAEVAARRGERT